MAQLVPECADQLMTNHKVFLGGVPDKQRKCFAAWLKANPLLWADMVLCVDVVTVASFISLSFIVITA
jgi:hypothetical protein